MKRARRTVGRAEAKARREARAKAKRERKGDAPDAQCYSLPDGDCIAESCMHTDLPLDLRGLEADYDDEFPS